MNTEYFSVDMCAYAEEIKHLHYILPRIHISILAHDLIVESISLR